MSRTTVTGDSYTTDDPANKVGVTYMLGITFGILVFLIILSYTSYKCNRSIHSSSTPPADDDINDHHQPVTVHRGVGDDVLVSFPVFIYSEQTRTNSGNCSDCSICLADYKPADVVRLLPECDHLFHVSCIDTWLKVHSTCPMCRNSPSPLAVKLSIQRS